MTVTIRHAGPGDEPAIVDLIQELAVAVDEQSPADHHYVRRYLASPDTTILLAIDERDIVGMLSYSTRPGLFLAGDSGEIEILLVDARRRRQGIGTKLLRTAIRLMQDAGCVETSASVNADNELAQKIYVDAGLAGASVRLEKHFGR